MDANIWHGLLLSKSFGDRLTDLSKAIAKMTTLMCTERCEERTGETWKHFSLAHSFRQTETLAFAQKVLRRIFGKSVTTVLKKDPMIYKMTKVVEIACWVKFLMTSYTNF